MNDPLFEMNIVKIHALTFFGTYFFWIELMMVAFLLLPMFSYEFFFSKSGLVCSSLGHARTLGRTDKPRQEVKVSALAIMAFTM